MSPSPDENQIPNIPDLSLANDRFLLNKGPDNLKDDTRTRLLKAVEEKNMAPFYKLLVEEFGFPLDQQLYGRLEAANKEALQKIDEKVADAEQNQGETEVNEALLEKADLYASIGDKENALTAYNSLLEKNITLGTRIDIVFTLVRIGLFFDDNSLVRSNIDKLKELVEQGGDWDRRNRLKAYEGVYLMSIRDFKGAAALFIQTLSTFTSTEIVSYQDFVKFAVLTSIFSLQRADIKKEVLDSPEINKVISEIPGLKDLVESLYNCNYASFFIALADAETNHLVKCRYLYPHVRYYVREMRIVAYAQQLESYRSLTIESMAKSFGVTESYIDSELYKFIAAGRLNCVIDKVKGIIVTNRPDAKNAQYQTVIKQGDILFNRVQKLSRVINV